MWVESLPLLVLAYLKKKSIYLLHQKVKVAIIMMTLAEKMGDDDEGINCHQSCSGLEMNQMMWATN